MTTAKDVLDRTQSFDDDFSVYSARESPPTKAKIDAAEKALGVKLRPDHRALIALLGCAAVLAKESVWPRLQPFEVAPSWRFFHGVEIFGLSSPAVPALDVVKQAKAWKPDGKGVFVPAIHRVGDPSCVGYDLRGRLHTWKPGEVPAKLSAGSLVKVLLSWLDTLMSDKERVRASAAPLPTKSPRAKAGDAVDASLDAWLVRLASDWTGKVAKELSSLDVPVRDRFVERVLQDTAKSKPSVDMVRRLHLITFDARVFPRIFALATHANAEVRETAVSQLGYVEELPAKGVKVLVAALEDTKVDVRKCAAESLAEHCVAPAVPPLMRAFAAQRKRKDWFKDVYPGTLLESLAACGAGRDDVTDLLVAHLALPDRYATLPAYKALISLGARAARAIPALTELANGKDAWREMHARHALAVITGNKKPHLARLRAGLEVKDAGGAVRASAQLALKALGEKV